MNKLFIIAVMAMLFSGCAMTDEEWNDLWTHSNTYRNWDHMKFSWSGYNHPTVETGRMSREQGWWGKPVPGPGE
jgi:hypothetical protein